MYVLAVLKNIMHLTNLNIIYRFRDLEKWIEPSIYDLEGMYCKFSKNKI